MSRACRRLKSSLAMARNASWAATPAEVVGRALVGCVELAVDLGAVLVVAPHIDFAAPLGVDEAAQRLPLGVLEQEAGVARQRRDGAGFQLLGRRRGEGGVV